MLLTPHTFVGIAIGASISNPFIAVPLALATHFVGDRVPHWDFFSNTTKEERRFGWRPLAVMADLVVGVAIGLMATLYALWVMSEPSTALNIFLCGIASVLPDALEGPYIYMKSEPKILSYITGFQRRCQFQAPLPWGLLTQVVIMVLAALVFFQSIF